MSERTESSRHEESSKKKCNRQTDLETKPERRSAVALVAGLNGTASLFKVDGKSNPKISTVNFQNFPIRTAHFSSSGDQFFVGSQHFPHFFVYDLNSGKTMKVILEQETFDQMKFPL